MKAKGEVTYITVKDSINRDFKRLLMFSIAMTIIALIISIACMKLGIENEALQLENKQLNKVIEMKNSQIADLEENCKDLFVELETLKGW